MNKVITRVITRVILALFSIKITSSTILYAVYIIVKCRYLVYR